MASCQTAWQFYLYANGVNLYRFAGFKLQKLFPNCKLELENDIFLVFGYEEKSKVILTSMEPNILRMVFSIKNQKNYDVVNLL